MRLRVKSAERPSRPLYHAPEAALQPAGFTRRNHNAHLPPRANFGRCHGEHQLRAAPRAEAGLAGDAARDTGAGASRGSGHATPDTRPLGYFSHGASPSDPYLLD